MDEVAAQYFHTMSSQVILICTFLSGFSATILGGFVIKEEQSRITKVIMLALLTATCSMLICLFVLTNIFIITTEGYPGKANTSEDLNAQFTYSMTMFIIGIISFLTFISLTGWLNSRRMGIITSIMGVGTLIAILMVLN